MENLSNKTQKSRIWYIGLFLYLLIFIYGLLFLHLTGINSRIVNEVWNLGHVFGFAVLMIFVIKISNTYSNLPILSQFILACLFASLCGLIVEVIQTYIGRLFSLNDILLSVLGAASAVVFFSPGLHAVDGRVTKLLRFAVILGLLVVSGNAIIYSYDAYQAHRRFPVLTNLGSQLELTHWKGHPVRSRLTKFQQSNVLKTVFLPAKYSTLILGHFPSDWSNYRNIKIIAYNPDHDDMKLEIRIHDQKHVENGSRYSDRYNGQLILKHGWNTSVISLDGIKHAPGKREMDMQRIHQLMLYFKNLAVRKTLLIKEIRLTD